MPRGYPPGEPGVEQQKEENEAYDEEAYKTDMASDKLPKGFPKRKDKSKKCGSMPIDIDAVRTELEETQEKITELETANLGERFLGVVFCIVERPSDASKVIDGQLGPAYKTIISIICCLCSSCFDKGFYWNYMRAPEPSDIYWENLGYRFIERTLRGCVSLIGTSILLAVCVLAIWGLKQL